MTAEPSLLEALYRLTRSDLSRERFGPPSVCSTLADFALVRVTRMARFWAIEGAPCRLADWTTRLLMALHAQRRQWLFLLHGHGHAVESWFGVPRDSMSPPQVASLLRGTFPDCRIDERVGPGFVFRSVPRAIVVTGTPSSVRADGGVSDQLEAVVRGMVGSHWVYAVLATPVPIVEITAGIADLATTIQEAHLSFLLKTREVQEQDRLARRYVELLETKLGRWERGRATGLWKAEVSLHAADAMALEVGRGLLQGGFSGEHSRPEPICCCPVDPTCEDSPDLEPLSSDELALFVGPLKEEHSGYEVVEYVRYGVETAPRMVPGPPTVSLGVVLDRGESTGNPVEVALDDLTKHVLICGVTGGGKTNTCIALLQQLRRKGVPFLVVEPAKSEYRHLIGDEPFRDLTVFTVGDETVAPLRLNPFEVPTGILVQTHIDYLKSLFSAAFVLYPPMPYVLERSLQEVYEDQGWNVARNENRLGADSHWAFPTLGHLADKIGTVVDRMGYDDRITMDVKAGLLARVNQLRLGGGKGRVLDTRRSVPSSVLFDSPCLLELKSVVSDDEKAFLIGLILIRLYEHREVRAGHRSGLSHVTLIEEAHRLLRNTSTEQNSDVAANPRGRAIEVFANLLSEIRAFGEGVVIAEQIPSKLTPDAVKNTSTKVVHRLLAADDRTLLAGTINLDESQERHIALLTVGEAVVFTEGMQKPVLVRMPLVKDGSGSRTTDSQLQTRIADADWADNGCVYNPSPVCRKCSHRSTGVGCCSVRTDFTDEELLEGRHLFNGLRFGESSVLGDLSNLRRSDGTQKGVATAYCTAARAFEREIETRARFYGRPFSEAEEVLERACAALGWIEHGRTARLSLEERSDLVEQLAALKQSLALLHDPAARPLHGCSLCPRPCQFRFDVLATTSAADDAAFARAFRSPRVGFEQLLGICRAKAIDAFPALRGTAVVDATYCVFLHYLSSMRVSRSRATQLAVHASEALIRGNQEQRDAAR